MRVLKYVMEHVRTNGKNTLTPRLFVKTKADNYKILELPSVFFEDVQNRDAATYAIKYINNNTSTEFCCFVAEAKMGILEIEEATLELSKKRELFDGITCIFQGVNDKDSDVMAFTIDDSNVIKPMITSSDNAKDVFESPFKFLF